ncbi:hypothetical protein ALC60_13580 [Trachymyrmex zeteki]|uniref:Uncharacterized protein n=1 Tax=Mycetomoellerius zeteki TaxID=64791 RepID=A0A151WHX8_9HYME|nr:hypothetical protein ALC60_13580 [Trachymyrmex zeteki]
MPSGHNSAFYERGLCSYARFATYESLSTNGEAPSLGVNYSYLERSNASPSQSGKRISRLGTRWRMLARWRTRDKRRDIERNQETSKRLSIVLVIIIGCQSHMVVRFPKNEVPFVSDLALSRKKSPTVDRYCHTASATLRHPPVMLSKGERYRLDCIIIKRDKGRRVSDVTNEPECAFERVLRIGHGELRTEIPSYGVTDREWSRTPRGEFLLGRRGTVRDKTDVLIEVPPLAFPIAELRSAFDRIVLNAYLRAALPRAMHEEPRVIAGIVDE